MIVGEQHDDPLDTASTHTLVVDKWHVIPRHLLKLIYVSLFLSTLAFVFAIVDNVISNRLPKDMAIAVLAYVFLLPYHCATLLLEWLRRHQTESIFPFTPSHPRALVYAFILMGLWVVSVILCSMNLHRVSGPIEICFYFYLPDGTIDWKTSTCDTRTPGMINYWTSFASTLISGLELTLLISITLVCYIHYRRKMVTVRAEAETRTSLRLQVVQGERKVLSA